jgi:hypothetical protein
VISKAVGRQRLTGGQDKLDLSLERTELAIRGRGGSPSPIMSSRMAQLSRWWRANASSLK